MACGSVGGGEGSRPGNVQYAAILQTPRPSALFAAWRSALQSGYEACAGGFLGSIMFGPLDSPSASIDGETR